MPGQGTARRTSGPSSACRTTRRTSAASPAGGGAARVQVTGDRDRVDVVVQRAGVVGLAARQRGVAGPAERLGRADHTVAAGDAERSTPMMSKRCSNSGLKSDAAANAKSMPEPPRPARIDQQRADPPDRVARRTPRHRELEGRAARVRPVDWKRQRATRHRRLLRHARHLISPISPPPGGRMTCRQGRHDRRGCRRLANKTGRKQRSGQSALRRGSERATAGLWWIACVGVVQFTVPMLPPSMR